MQMDMKVGLGRWEKSLSSNALERLRVGSLRCEPTASKAVVVTLIEPTMRRFFSRLPLTRISFYYGVGFGT